MNAVDQLLKLLFRARCHGSRAHLRLTRDTHRIDQDGGSADQVWDRKTVFEDEIGDASQLRDELQKLLNKSD